MKRNITFCFLFFYSVILFAEPVHIKLWKGEPAVKNNHVELIYFPATTAQTNHPAVIICPGGSYHHLGIPHEGIKTAKWFNSKDIAAFVLRYRVAMSGHHHPAMIEDFQRAMQLVRENADIYYINPNKIGAIGFSAGGHLVLMGGAFSNNNYLQKLGIQTAVSLRPNWIAPIYPVVSMQDSIAHEWSRKSLLGKNPTQQQKDDFSMEINIPADMPPVFLQASKDDPVVDCRNSIYLDQTLTNHHINHKFLLFETGGHGYGMKETNFTTTTQWNELLYKWLQTIDMVSIN